MANNKQKKQKTPAQKAKAKQRRSRTRNRKRAGGNASAGGKKMVRASNGGGRGDSSDWARVLANPFLRIPTHIPDMNAAPSGCVRFRVYGKLNFPANGGSSSAIWSGGFLLAPDLYQMLTFFGPNAAGSSTLTDLAGNGANWFQSVISVPNGNAIVGTSDCMFRFVGLAGKFAYLGTELNRSGRWIVGMLNNQGTAGTVATTGTQLSLLSVCAGSYSATVTTIEQSMRDPEEHKISGNNELFARWLPSNTPSYMMAQNGLSPNAEWPYSTTGGAAVAQSYFTAPPRSNGIEQGVGVLAVMFDGDTTAASATSSNAFSYQIEGLIEVIPNRPQSVTYDLTESPYNANQLYAGSKALNSLKCSQSVF
jgi:hypothetical protein